MSLVKQLYHFLSSRHQNVFLDYKVKPMTRKGLDPHPLLMDIIANGIDGYTELLEEFLSHFETFTAIKRSEENTNSAEPAWNNGFLPGLDMITIYGMLAHFKPGKYIEIGSGNSTKMARFAIDKQGLSTKITSVDPFPRAEIDKLADTIIRQPLEELEDLSFIAGKLEKNDILFIDNSHRSFSNSDVTVCFLEILPFLKPGVVVHVHDIYLPYDYPNFMAERFYNEQYMLAGMILANPERYQPIMPNYYVSRTAELHKIMTPVWNHPALAGVEQHGGSFWMRIS
ncbi:MAG: class I SAM-dependent methyltransferase [Bacteroidota bacterium]